jgi:Ca2+-binding RTX toxin-like protein
MIGTGAPDPLYGLGGNDTLDGLGGADDMSGGRGNDTYIVDNGSDLVREHAGEGSDLVYTSVSYALAAGQEVETLSTRVHGGTAAINLVGNEFAQTIYGNYGANTIDGRGGADVMAGLAGDDIYVVDNALDQVLESAGQGNDAIFTSTSYVLASNQEIETLSTQTHAGTDDLFLTGNQYNNTLIGNAGDNIMNGVGGADVMIGLAGDDTYAIDDAGDLVIDGFGQGNDLVLTYLSHTLSNGNQIETLSTVFHQGTDAINLGGNDYNNTLIGNYGANYLNGNGGVDVMIGLNGNDTYVADNAGDVVQEAAGGGADLLFSFVSYVLAAGQEVETVSTAVQGGTAALALTGNEYAQTIIGNAGANLLDGKGGSDTLYGLGGADTFAFTTALGAGNVDTVADFVAGTDRIGLDDAVFTAIGGTLNANAFVIGTAAADADDRILYNSTTGALLYDADGVGGAAAVQFATLSTGLVLTAGDFMVI